MAITNSAFKNIKRFFLNYNRLTLIHSKERKEGQKVGREVGMEGEVRTKVETSVDQWKTDMGRVHCEISKGQSQNED